MKSDDTTPEVRRALLAEAERIAEMGSWVWDVRTDKHTWSENLFQILGFEQDGVVPSTALFHNVVHPDDREHVASQMAQAAETRAAPREPVEYRVIRKGGEVRTLLARVVAVRDADGGLIRFVGTVTDRTRAIAQRAEADRARDVMEVSQQIAQLGSWEWDPNTGDTTTSAEGLRILGVEGDMNWDRFMQLIHPDDARALQTLREQVFADESGGPLLVRYTRPEDGERRFLEIQAKTLGDPATSPHIGTLHDVTRRVQLEQQLLLSRTMEATGRLAAGVAHDFNNLLMVVMSSAFDLAAERPDERLDEIIAASESGAKLVQRLLTFGRKTPKEPQVVELSEQIRDLAGWLNRVLGDDIVLDLRVAEEPVRVRADPAQLQQVLLNLTVNARDAMPDGGTIAIECTTSDGQAVLRVIDQGRGMEEEVQRKAFEPFFSTKEVGDGSGLGLFMVYGVVSQLGGSVQLSSQRGQGTQVEIVLPLVEGEEHAEVPPVAELSEPDALTILVVEDDKAVRAITVRILERAGHKVIEATGPNQAAVRWKEERPDLVLSDLAMPDGGGKRVAKLLADEHPTVPIVFMTGYAPPEGVLPGPVLNKPFRAADLSRAIDEALRARG